MGRVHPDDIGKMKWLKKILIVIFIFIVIIAAMYFCIREFATKPFLHHNYSLYENKEYLDKVGGKEAHELFENNILAIKEASNKDFYYLDGKNSFLFYHYCDSVFYLSCDYDILDYETNKSFVLINNDFILEDMRQDGNLLVFATYEKDGYFFKSIRQESTYNYPSQFGMIAFNDEKKNISFIYFYNPSLDYIVDTEDYIKTNLFFMFS